MFTVPAKPLEVDVGEPAPPPNEAFPAVAPTVVPAPPPPAYPKPSIQNEPLPPLPAVGPFVPT